MSQRSEVAEGVDEQGVLAKVRTLLALERNYLAEERTALAEFRNGLALTVIGPTASTVLAFILSRFPMENAILYDLLNFTFFSILTLMGVWTSFQSRSKLRRIRRRKKLLKEREVDIVRCCETVEDMFSDIITFEEMAESDL